ncbi:MAG: exodeoxyribonuclease III [Deltaproteobacteria bacterium]|nr:exodeoxyribonuclease III [Deltaproteobacteria bacterium]
MKLITWNVNGIRAAARKGFLDWLIQEAPDVLCLQETKACPSQLDQDLLKPVGYTATHWASAEKKGYSGVAFFVKESPLQVITGLGIPEFDCEGRTLTAEFADFILLTGYFPNGKDDLSRIPYKLRYSEAAKNFALTLKQQKQKPMIICGDINTAHQPIDIARPKENEGNTGFTPAERAWLTQFLQSGFVDIFREREPSPHHYTWWSYRANARANNVGWRIDYFFVTPELCPRVQRVYHQPHVMGSDHCPVVLELT